MQIDVVVRGDRQAAELVGRLSRRLADGRPQLLGLVDKLLHAERERFAGRGARWRRLAPATIRAKAREGHDPRTLVLTGELMRSLTIRGYRHQIIEVRPGQLRFGTRLWYAKFHNRGLGVPRRTVVGLTRVQRKDVVAELRRLLIGDDL